MVVLDQKCFLMTAGSIRCKQSERIPRQCPDHDLDQGHRYLDPDRHKRSRQCKPDPESGLKPQVLHANSFKILRRIKKLLPGFIPGRSQKSASRTPPPPGVKPW
jgi:hypothetical protein